MNLEQFGRSKRLTCRNWNVFYAMSHSIKVKVMRSHKYSLIKKSCFELLRHTEHLQLFFCACFLCFGLIRLNVLINPFFYPDGPFWSIVGLTPIYLCIYASVYRFVYTFIAFQPHARRPTSSASYIYIYIYIYSIYLSIYLDLDL